MGSLDFQSTTKEMCTNQEKIAAPEKNGEDGNGKKSDGKAKLEEGFYLIEAIRKKRTRKGEVQYLVKWLGWSDTKNTWEPLANLQSCPDLVSAFEDSLKKRKNSCRKRKQRSTAATQPPKKKRHAREDSLSHSPTEDCVKEVNPVSDGADGAVENELNLKISELKATNRGGQEHDTLLSGRSIGAYLAKRREVRSITRPELEAGARITEILKMVSYKISTINNVRDVLITFMAKRADGGEKRVTNKFLRSNYPDLLIKFYEHHHQFAT